MAVIAAGADDAGIGVGSAAVLECIDGVDDGNLDMSDGLADFRPNGLVTGCEWRTPPHWGIGHGGDGQRAHELSSRWQSTLAARGGTLASRRGCRSRGAAPPRCRRVAMSHRIEIGRSHRRHGADELDAAARIVRRAVSGDRRQQFVVGGGGRRGAGLGSTAGERGGGALGYAPKSQARRAGRVFFEPRSRSYFAPFSCADGSQRANGHRLGASANRFVVRFEASLAGNSEVILSARCEF